MSLLIRRLIEHAHGRPNEVAVHEFGGARLRRTTTWRELHDSACQLRRYWANSGEGAIMVVSRNRTEVLVAFLGALWAGRRTFAVSPLSSGSELRQLVEAASVSTCIGDSPVLAELGDGVRDTLVIDSLLAGGEQVSPTAQADFGANGAVLFQSSGTTGTAKLVVRETDALDVVGRNVADALRLRCKDRLLVTIPLYHSYGIDTALLGFVIAGCGLELHEGFNPVAVREALSQREVSVWPAVPIMLDALSRGKEPASAPGALDRVVSAGSPLPPRIALRFEERWNVKVGQLYGSSEFGSITYHEPRESETRPGCVGMPMKDVRIRVLDMAEPRISSPLPTGKEGEIAVATPSMMSGYVGESPKFWTCEDGEFLRTGDTGFVDSAGQLFLTGRTKFFINVGAKKVNPIEVEAALSRFPGVREVIVVATPFSATADRVKAIILPEPETELNVVALRAYARRHLTPFKVPRSIEVRRELPRTPTGKILRSELQAVERGLGHRAAPPDEREIR